MGCGASSEKKTAAKPDPRVPAAGPPQQQPARVPSPGAADGPKPLPEKAVVPCAPPPRLGAKHIAPRIEAFDLPRDGFAALYPEGYKPPLLREGLRGLPEAYGDKVSAEQIAQLFEEMDKCDAASCGWWPLVGVPQLPGWRVEHGEAIFAYTYELYEKDGGRQSWQLYSELNRMLYADHFVAQALQPLAYWLTEAMRLLPPYRGYAFRGMRRRIDKEGEYVPGGHIVWQAFSSSSLSLTVAESFAATESGSTLFLLWSDTAVDITPFSYFGSAEEERLFPANTRFVVARALPETHLQMLGVNMDVVLLRQTAPPPEAHLANAVTNGPQDPGTELGHKLEAVRQLAFIYRRLLNTFVPPLGKTSVSSPVSFDITERILDFLREPAAPDASGYMDSSPERARATLVYGCAGSGKSTLLIHFMVRLLDTSAPYFPLLISLPQVRGVFTPGRLAQSIREEYCLTPPEAEILLTQAVALLLDSYDEIALHEYPSGATLASQHNLAELNSFAQSWPNVRLVLSCRLEFISSRVSDTGSVFGFPHRRLDSYFIAPFQSDQIQQCLELCSKSQPEPTSPASSVSIEAVNAINGFMPLLESPFVISLAVEGFPQLATTWLPSTDAGNHFRRLTRHEVYTAAYKAIARRAALRFGFTDADAVVCEGYCRALAQFLHRNHICVATVRDALEASGKILAESQELPSDEVQARLFQCCPLRIDRFHPDATFSFRHKSLQEFHVANAVYEKVELVAQCEATTPVADFFAERFHLEGKEEELTSELLRIIRATRSADGNSKGAGNALSLLVACRRSLAQTDLSGIRVDCARLSGAVLHDCSLRGATLQNVDISGAILRGTDFSDCRMDTVDARQLVFSGHQGPVHWVCAAPDGEHCITAGDDGQVILWGGHGEEKLRLPAHSGGAKCVAIAPDGATFCTGGCDALARIWDFNGGELFALTGHTQEVLCVCYSQDQALIATGSQDMSIRTWSTSTGAVQLVLTGHAAGVSSVRFFESSVLYSGSSDYTIRKWDPTNGQAMATFDGCEAQSIDVSPDGKFLVVTGSMTVLLNAGDGTEVQSFPFHEYGSCCARFSPDGLFVATASQSDKVAVLWTVDGGQICQLGNHGSGLCCVNFSPDGQFLYTTSFDETARKWHLNPSDAAGGTANPGGQSAWFLPDSRHILAGGATTDMQVRVSDFYGRELRNYDCAMSVTGVDYSRDGKHFLIWNDAFVKVFNFEDGSLVLETTSTSTVCGAWFLPGKDAVVTSDSGQTLRRYAFDNTTHEIDTHNSINCAAPSPDGSAVLIGSIGCARVYSLEPEPALIREYPVPGSVIAVAFHPNGSRVVLAYSSMTGEDPMLGIWEGGSQIAQASLQEPCTALMFSRDGLRIAAGLTYGSAAVYSDQCELICTLPANDYRIRSVDISTDRIHYLVASESGTIHLWRVDEGKDMQQQQDPTVSLVTVIRRATAIEATGAKITGAVMSCGLRQLMLHLGATDA